MAGKAQVTDVVPSAIMQLCPADPGFLSTLAGVELTFNLYTALTLWAAGVAGVAAWWRAGATHRGATRYWLLAGAGMLYLGFDEHLSLHEELGRELARLGAPAFGMHDIDGLVLAVFGLAGLAVSALHWRELRAHPPVLRLLAAGIGFTAIAVAQDDDGSNDGTAGWAEERLEWLGSATFLAGFAQRYRRAGRRLAAPSAAAPATPGEDEEERGPQPAPEAATDPGISASPG